MTTCNSEFACIEASLCSAFHDAVSAPRHLEESVAYLRFRVPGAPYRRRRRRLRSNREPDAVDVAPVDGLLRSEASIGAVASEPR